jgi:hypothetical protein
MTEEQNNGAASASHAASPFPGLRPRAYGQGDDRDEVVRHATALLAAVGPDFHRDDEGRQGHGARHALS